MKNPSEPADDLSETAFGQRAIQHGFVTQEQVQEALSDREQARLMGQRVKPLGEILMDRGLLNPEQVLELMEGSAAPPPQAAPSKRPSGAGRAKTVPFGKYTLLREIGRGGRGVVYEALDGVLNRKVALKTIQAGIQAKDLAAEEQRFLTEARISASLPKHPHLVSVYEAGEFEGRRYLAMELIPGQSMQRWRKTTDANFERQLELIRDVALALDHAHRHGVVHRDVKPQNILVDTEGRPHLTDFGLARMTGQKEDLLQAGKGHVWGTPTYMSPEHARGQPVDKRADVYALGVMLYEAVLGHAPFRGQNSTEILQKLARDPVPVFAKSANSASLGPKQRAVEPVCLKALAKNPAERHPSAAAFAEDLGRAVTADASKKRRLIWGGAAAAAALLVVAGAMVAFSTSSKRAPSESPETAAAMEERHRKEIEREKQQAADGARQQAEDLARGEKDELKRVMTRQRQASEEESTLLKVEQAKSEEARREAEERARAALESAKKSETPSKESLESPAVAVLPAAPTAPGVAKPNTPVPPRPIAALTGEPTLLAEGVLHFEAEDFSGGENPVEGIDYHDTTPGNSGKAYRMSNVDIAASGDGTTYLMDIAAGEWLHYRFTGGGRYQANFRYLHRGAARVHFEVDGTNTGGPIDLTSSPDKRTWVSHGGPVLRIPSGSHDLRLVFDTAVHMFDAFELKPVTLLPVPQATALLDAERSVRELFKDDYLRKGPADLQALARKLILEGTRAQEEPPMRYVLLGEARDLAAQAGDVVTALAAISALESGFQVETSAMKLSMLATAARGVHTPEAVKLLGDTYGVLIEQAFDADDFEGALTIASKAEGAFKGAGNPAQASRYQVRGKELSALRDEYRALDSSLRILREKPDDPTASLALGVFYCFSKGDWSQGLALLSKGSDPAMAGAARSELGSGGDPTLQAAAGDAWREVSERKSGVLKARSQSRAIYWYEKAVTGLVGIARLKVDAQTETLYKALGNETLKKGLLFWVEPGKDSQDGFREFVSGGRATNNGASLVDAGGRALAFSKKFAFVEYPASDAVRNIESQGSVFAWLKLDKGIRNGCVVTRGENRFDDWSFLVEKDRLALTFTAPEGRRRVMSRTPIAADRWVFCGVTWDGTNAVFYVDGKEDVSVPLAPVDLANRRAARIRLGSDLSGGSEFMGSVGATLIYGRPVTPQETMGFYIGMRGRFR